MQQAAKSDDYQQWRDGVWKQLASRIIPRGPGFAYFMDMKIKLWMFMNENPDRQAVEKAADEYKKELDDYSKTAMPPMIVNNDTLPEQPVPETRTLYFSYHPPDGNEVKVPADFLPPFAGGDLPADLKLRIVNEKPQDADALLGIMWNYYAQLQAMKQAKEKAELERIASGNPVLISEESIPPEFRKGVPMDLAIRLSGLHKASDIVAEMVAYKSEHQAGQSDMMLPDPMAEMRAALPMPVVGFRVTLLHSWNATLNRQQLRNKPTFTLSLIIIQSTRLIRLDFGELSQQKFDDQWKVLLMQTETLSIPPISHQYLVAFSQNPNDKTVLLDPFDWEFNFNCLTKPGGGFFLRINESQEMRTK